MVNNIESETVLIEELRTRDPSKILMGTDWIERSAKLDGLSSSWLVKLERPSSVLTGMASSRAYRVLVADNHVVVRRGLRALLESQRDVEVCGEVSNGLEAVEFVKKSRPDLVVLDLAMPDMDGLKVTRAIREVSTETEVL